MTKGDALGLEVEGHVREAMDRQMGQVDFHRLEVPRYVSQIQHREMGEVHLREVEGQTVQPDSRCCWEFGP